MKYKTLFRMLLKAIGVWVSIQGAAGAVTSAGYVFMGVGNPVFLFHSIASLGQIGIGLYLFFGGKWIADKAMPGNRPYCHECGYDLTNAAGSVCAECGTPFKPTEVSSAL